MKNLLIKEFEKLNITQFGFADAQTLPEHIFANGEMFSNRKKINHISDIMPDCKSIISFLIPYNHRKNPGNISMYATGKDYHIVANSLCSQIGKVLTDNGYSYKAFADISPLKERAIAKLCGLGIIGENGFLINKAYGTYTFIAWIATDCHLEPSTEIEGFCDRCGKCHEHCPGKAISRSGFNAETCVSYITQKKGELTKAEKKLIKQSCSAWGCDICQKVCPMNKDKEFTPLKEFNENLILYINNEYLSNKEFKEKYKERAFSWRGKATLYRNLSILDDITID